MKNIAIDIKEINKKSKKSKVLSLIVTETEIGILDNGVKDLTAEQRRKVLNAVMSVLRIEFDDTIQKNWLSFDGKCECPGCQTRH